VLALSRLEREHVALLLAICELEGPATTADANSEVLRAALLPMLRDDLRQTQHALQLAAEGRYGACEDCHKPFTSRQLELRPASTRCSVCESRRHTMVLD
jgi:RNA polymerase-binding transcription factor DksA